MLKKIKVNYLVNYSFEVEKLNFIGTVNKLNEILIKNNGNLIILDDISFGSAHFDLYTKVNFILEKKTLKYLFQNLLKQLSDNTDIDIVLSVKYGIKTIKRLINIFNNKKDFFEVKKADLLNFISEKFTQSKIKTANLTIDENFKLPDFISAKNFISAELITLDNKQEKILTNNYQKMIDFINQ